MKLEIENRIILNNFFIGYPKNIERSLMPDSIITNIPNITNSELMSQLKKFNEFFCNENTIEIIDDYLKFIRI
jgi:hypothetical protein